METNKPPTPGQRGIDVIAERQKAWAAERAARIAKTQGPVPPNPRRGVQPGPHPKFNPAGNAVAQYLKANTGKQG
jgi:hypothetical protein